MLTAQACKKAVRLSQASGRAMSRFLSEDSLCGKALLDLVARGSAIIAELLRLSEHIPSVLLPGATDTRYLPVLFNFR
jgi:WASH complex subunit strumpellin